MHVHLTCDVLCTHVLGLCSEDLQASHRVAHVLHRFRSIRPTPPTLCTCNNDGGHTNVYVCMYVYVCVCTYVLCVMHGRTQLNQHQAKRASLITAAAHVSPETSPAASDLL